MRHDFFLWEPTNKLASTQHCTNRTIAAIALPNVMCSLFDCRVSLGWYFLFSGIYFLDEKNVPARIPEDFFFSCIFRRIFSQEHGFGGGRWNSCFFIFTGIFCSNSCGTRITVFTPDSSGFLFPPKAVWLRPATKEGSLLSKIWTKIDLFNLSPEQDLIMFSAAPILC